ncbi:MAG: hypothetical protein EOM70_13255 [Clostridia bacterium]|nr:hypothetical protein [Clostridia bacterium]
MATVRTATAGLDSTCLALALSTQGASSLLLDQNHQPLTPALSWMDTRAEYQALAIKENLGDDTIYKITGWPCESSLDMAKYAWLHEKEPERVRQAAAYVSTIDYIQLRLTGQLCIDPSNAAMRQLMDIQTLQWDTRILSEIDLPERQLPTIRKSGEQIGTLTLAAAADLGLDPSVVVILGAHDQYCGAVGAMALEPGEIVLSTGTAWALLATVDHLVYSPSRLSPGPHALPGLYGALATISTGGMTLDWLNQKITGLDYAAIESWLADSPVRHPNLLFYPYLAGANHPTWQAQHRGVFLGLELGHDRFDMTLACLEGLAFQTRLILDDYEQAGIPVQRIKVIGGATRSPAWMGILQAVCGIPLDVLELADASCLGAAAIAGVGCGLFSDYSEAATRIASQTRTLSVVSADQDFYQVKYRLFKDHLNVSGHPGNGGF